MGIGDRAYMRNQRLAREPISVTAWVVGVLVAFFILGLISEGIELVFFSSSLNFDFSLLLLGGSGLSSLGGSSLRCGSLCGVLLLFSH